MDDIAFRQHVAESFDGIPLHYSVRGSGGTTLFFIHGWSCSQKFWHYQATGSSAQYRLVTLDLAGHGRSRVGLAKRQLWSIESFARDIETVADAIGAERFALAGHSMGGPIALETALRVRERCRMVLGVDTFTDATFYRALPAFEIAARCRPFEENYPRAIAAMVARISAPETDVRTSAWIASAMSRTDSSVGLAVLEALLAWDITTRWPLVRCPVETINSASLESGNELRLDRLTVHRMVGVGHFPMLEAPARFNALAREILERCLGAATPER